MYMVQRVARKTVQLSESGGSSQPPLRCELFVNWSELGEMVTLLVLG